MKFIKKCSAMLIAVLAICMLMSVSAFAAETPVFSDVNADSPWYDGVTYAAEHGITSGTGNGCFSPDNNITVRQWAVMICRAFGKEVEETADKSFGTAQLALAFKEGWLDVGAMIDPDSAMCRAYTYESIFRVAKIPVFSAELYENIVPYENRYVSIAKANDLCKESDHGLDLVTRGEAVQIIYLIQTRNIEIAKPQILDKIHIVNADQVNLDRYLVELQKIPETILYEFNSRGWSYRVDSKYVDDFGERIGMECAGCCSYANKSVYVKADYATVHEIGHFYHKLIGFTGITEELFEKEAAGAEKVLGTYATTNHKEYFAEVFDYWIRWSGNEDKLAVLKMIAPETYAYFGELQEENWTGVSNEKLVK